MSYSVTRAKQFTASKAWGAHSIASMNGVSTRLHWANEPYVWHVNDGEEVFAVLDGAVDMHVKTAGAVEIVALAVGDVFFAALGCEHVAHPRGEARILVVKKSRQRLAETQCSNMQHKRCAPPRCG